MNDKFVPTRCITLVITDAYVPHFMVVYDSIRRFMPYIPIVVHYLGNTPNKLPQDITIITEIDPALRAKYTDKEYVCAVRPQLVLDLFLDGYDEVMFLGADVVFYQPFEFLFNKLQHSNVVIAPHCSTPLRPEDALRIHSTGQLNSDLVVWRHCEESIKFLGWQATQLNRECKYDPKAGHFYDQVWLSFLPYMMSGVFILRDGVTNVAWYNAKYYNLDTDDNGELVTRDGPVVAFQWSGFNREHPEKLTIHSKNFNLTGQLADHCLKYKKELEKHGLK